MLQEHLQAWSGEAFRHIPAGAPFDVLDFRFAGRGATNRWNEAGEPTLYLAGDIGVAIPEFGRHFAIDRTADLGKKTIERTVYRLGLTLDAVFDLRTAAVWSELSLSNAPLCFLDIPIARATARFIRTTTRAQGIIVPSVAFLDSLERWCLVVFLEKLPADPHAFISSVQVEGPLRWK
jgi:RES domain-containing protein